MEVDAKATVFSQIKSLAEVFSSNDFFSSIRQ